MSLPTAYKGWGYGCVPPSPTVREFCDKKSSTDRVVVVVVLIVCVFVG